MSEAWSQWQGQVIDGKFHLKQYLGGSGQSAVFLAHLSRGARAGYGDSGTEARPVAIRLIADSANPELQLSRWRMALDVSHPHLLRILDTGRCRLGVIDLIYAVTEYGEENLAQIILERPLTAQEAREMLEPALDALTYLHSRGMVHAHLKPASVMAIGDQLKLSSDGICPADQPFFLDEKDGLNRKGKPSAQGATKSDALKAAKPGIYDAPETASGVWSAAADVWSLGATLAEVLTQHPPSKNDLNDEADPLLPENLPVQFVEIVRGCLRRDLQLRWTIPTIRKRLQELTRVAPAPVPVKDLAGVLPAGAQALGSVDSAHAGVARAAVEMPSPANAVVANSVSGDRDKYQGTSSLGPSQAAIESGALAAAQENRAAQTPMVTFADVLRPKPVASQETVIRQPIARAAAGTAVAPEQTQVLTGTHGVQALSAVARIRAAAEGNRIPNANSTDDAPHTRDKYKSTSSLRPRSVPSKSGALAPALAIPGRALLATVIAQAMPAMRRLTSKTSAAIQHLTSQIAAAARRVTLRTKTAAQRLVTQAKRADLVIAAQIEALFRRVNEQTVQRLGLAIMVTFTVAVALYVSLGVLRHKPAGQIARETTKPAPKVIIAHPERKPLSKTSPKKRPSAASAKPQPGTRQAAQPAPQTQAAQSPAPAAVQSKTQPEPSQPQAQPVALKSEAQPGVRRIDDGGAQDDADEPTARAASVRSGNSSRNSRSNSSGNNNAASVSVDGVQPVMPQVSRSALHTIHGTVRVSVRVKVDPSGKVARAELANAGPSKYFARKSLEAAQNWKFAPGQNAGSPLLLHFEFRNSGARAFATRVGS